MNNEGGRWPHPCAKCTVSWLISELQIYLNGFWNGGIRPKTAKDSQKAAGGKYEFRAFTMATLTMPRRLQHFTAC
jgi:hypothetical protein